MPHIPAEVRGHYIDSEELKNYIRKTGEKELGTFSDLVNKNSNLTTHVEPRSPGVICSTLKKFQGDSTSPVSTAKNGLFCIEMRSKKIALNVRLHYFQTCNHA